MTRYPASTRMMAGTLGILLAGTGVGAAAQTAPTTPPANPAPRTPASASTAIAPAATPATTPSTATAPGQTPTPAPTRPRRDEDQPITVDRTDNDALFREIFGSERPAPNAGTYPVMIDDVHVGDYRILPGRGRDGTIDSAFLRNVLIPIALPELAEKLQPLLGNPTVDFAALRAAGIEVTFDPGILVLRIIVPSNLRNVRELALRNARRRQNVDYVEQADISAYASVRAGIDLVEDTSSRDRGFSGLAADIDLGFNLWGIAAQGRLRYTDRGNRRWTRGDFRLTYDDTDRLIRYELGDLSVGRRPFQMAPRMAGIAAYREYPINPYLNIRPVAERGFELDRPARVEVALNGVGVRTFDLPAGRFSLRDFPLVPSAANDIELRITYETGETQVLSFPAYYDIELLQPGLIDFAVNIGVPYTDDSRGRVYDRHNYNVMGYIRYGLSKTLTVGANWEGDEDFDLIGGEVIWASPIGSFAFNVSTNIRNPGPSSGRLAFQYAWRDSNAERGRSIDALLTLTGAEYRSLGDIFGGNLISRSFSVRAGQMFGQRIRAQVYGGYDHLRGLGDNYYAGANLTYQFRWGTVSLGAEYRHTIEDDGPVVRASLTIPLGRGTMSASYTSEQNQTRVEYTRMAASSVGAIGFSAGAEQRDGFDRQFARVNYTGNRFEAEIEQLRTNGRFGQHDLRSSFSLGTALVMADGTFAISRPVSNSFAIIGVDRSASQFRIAVDPRRGFGSTNTRYGAFSDAIGPAVLPNLPAYFDRSLEIDSPDAPAGTSVGGQVFMLRPGYRSGFRLSVGSAKNASIVGTMVDRTGTPLAFATGEARLVGGSESEQPLVLFTNAGGRFFLEGVTADSSYTVTVNIGTQSVTTTLTVPPDTTGIYRLADPVQLDLTIPVEGNRP